MAEMVKRFCNCDNDYQDKEYGNHIRLHTVGKDGKKETCTVCGKITKK
jgi:hypothetical protein